MPGVVSETHAVELKCDELREQIRQKYAARLSEVEGKARVAIKRAMDREIKQVVGAYLGAHPPRRSLLGTLIH